MYIMLVIHAVRIEHLRRDRLHILFGLVIAQGIIIRGIVGIEGAEYIIPIFRLDRRMIGYDSWSMFVYVRIIEYDTISDVFLDD